MTQAAEPPPKITPADFAEYVHDLACELAETADKLGLDRMADALHDVCDTASDEVERHGSLG